MHRVVAVRPTGIQGTPRKHAPREGGRASLGERRSKWRHARDLLLAPRVQAACGQDARRRG
eukprot:5289724-Pyramimonas_sp.AAC.1